MDRVSDDIKEKGLSADQVYDCATWRDMSTYIDPTYKWEYDEEEREGQIGGNNLSVLTI